jgi:hypothetical protein
MNANAEIKFAITRQEAWLVTTRRQLPRSAQRRIDQVVTCVGIAHGVVASFSATAAGRALVRSAAAAAARLSRAGGTGRRQRALRGRSLPLVTRSKTMRRA